VTELLEAALQGDVATRDLDETDEDPHATFLGPSPPDIRSPASDQPQTAARTPTLTSATTWYAPLIANHVYGRRLSPGGAIWVLVVSVLPGYRHYRRHGRMAKP
jgi:hypothetical protein